MRTWIEQNWGNPSKNTVECTYKEEERWKFYEKKNIVKNFYKGEERGKFYEKNIVKIFYKDGRTVKVGICKRKYDE